MDIDSITEFAKDAEGSEEQPFGLSHAVEMIDSEVTETEDAIKEGDNAATVDGFGDVAFLAINGIYKTFRNAGQDHETATESTEQVMDNIANANLAKRHDDGDFHKDEKGKVVKPEGWKAPDHSELFEENESEDEED